MGDFKGFFNHYIFWIFIAVVITAAILSNIL